MVKGYRLKDKEFQKKLDELTNGDFSKKLMGPLSRCLPDVYVVECGDVINKELKSRYRATRFCVHFKENELEKIHEYDPNSWNDYPDVTPPEDVWMRFEYKNVNDEIKDIEPCCNDDELIGVRLIYRNGEWRNSRNWPLCTNNIREARFRPWDET